MDALVSILRRKEGRKKFVLSFWLMLILAANDKWVKADKITSLPA